jgi:hypothetical protein
LAGAAGAQAAGQVAIQGTVPLTPQFAFVVAKNSGVSAHVSERLVVVNVEARGARDVPLPNRRLRLDFGGLAVRYVTTAADGFAQAPIHLPETSRRSVLLTVADVTYGVESAYKKQIEIPLPQPDSGVPKINVRISLLQPEKTPSQSLVLTLGWRILNDRYATDYARPLQVSFPSPGFGRLPDARDGPLPGGP